MSVITALIIRDLIENSFNCNIKRGSAKPNTIKTRNSTRKTYLLDLYWVSYFYSNKLPVVFSTETCNLIFEKLS